MKLGIDRKVPDSKCLNCGEALNGATGVMKEDGEDRAPQDGDVTVCYNCAHIMAFAESGGFRPLTDGEMYAVAGDKAVLAVVRAIGEARKRRGLH